MKSSFIQDATLKLLDELNVSQSIMHSTMRAGKAVSTVWEQKGLFVGGTIQAGERVTARTIGNSMSTATVVEVGVLPELRNEMIQLRNQLKVTDVIIWRKRVKHLSLLDQLAAVGQLSPDKLAMRIKLNHTKKQALDEQIYDQGTYSGD